MDAFEREMWEAELRARERQKRLRRRARQRRRRIRRRRRLLVVIAAAILLLLLLIGMIRLIIGLIPKGQQTEETPKQQTEQVQQSEEEQGQEVTPKNQVVTTQAGLNVRTGPGVSNKRVGLLPGGTTIITGEEKNNWAQLLSSGYTNYWICTDYVRSIDSVEKTGTVDTTGSMRMCLRAGPSTEFAVTMMIPNHTQLKIKFTTEMNGGTWYYTTYRGVSGWISSQYVR